MNRPAFVETNEKLDSIVAGLDLQPTDRVLSICGSGDQPLAILEQVSEVVAVDIVDTQFHYTKKRVEYLKKGEMVFFFNPLMPIEDKLWKRVIGKSEIVGDFVECIESRKYFTDARLEKLRSKLKRLIFLQEDIFNVDMGIFDKAYLSNAHHTTNDSKLSFSIKQNGLVYVATNQYEKEMLQQGFLRDTQLTALAVGDASPYDWSPVVYRKA